MSHSDPSPKSGLTYADAGVSIDAGDALVQAIKPLAKSTARPGADTGLGGFGGAFDLKAAGLQGSGFWVSGTDGVGTKLKLAISSGNTSTRSGFDLVAMCVNDILAQGAEPLYSSITSPPANSTPRAAPPSSRAYAERLPPIGLRADRRRNR